MFGPFDNGNSYSTGATTTNLFYWPSSTYGNNFNTYDHSTYSDCVIKITRENLRYLSRHESTAILARIREWTAQQSKGMILEIRDRFNKLVKGFRSFHHTALRFDRRIPCWRAGRWKSLT